MEKDGEYREQICKRCLAKKSDRILVDQETDIKEASPKSNFCLSDTIDSSDHKTSDEK